MNDHHHDFGLGLVGPDINVAVDCYPSLLDNTRYGTQIAPWLEAFGADAVRVVKFEDMSPTERASGSAGVGRASTSHHGPGDQVHNSADTGHVASGGWVRVNQHPAYRKVRPLLGEAVRRRLGRAVLPQAPSRPPGPSDVTVDRLVAELAPEVARLS